jgi:hypothetical protein
MLYHILTLINILIRDIFMRVSSLANKEATFDTIPVMNKYLKY